MTVTMAEEAYVLSFTAGALLYRESLTVARLFDEVRDWDAVRAQVLDGNLLRMRTQNASKRIFREVASRLKQLTAAELDLLLTGSRQEQQQLLWLAICKRYRFIYDFAVEVIREKFLRLDFELTYDDYDVFFNNKAEWHPEVAGVAESTRKKLRQVVFKMLREVNFLSPEGQILPALPTTREIAVITADAPEHLAVFPILPAEVEEQLP
jgi:hypothetical protein